MSSLLEILSETIDVKNQYLPSLHEERFLKTTCPKILDFALENTLDADELELVIRLGKIRSIFFEKLKATDKNKLKIVPLDAFLQEKDFFNHYAGIYLEEQKQETSLLKIIFKLIEAQFKGPVFLFSQKAIFPFMNEMKDKEFPDKGMSSHEALRHYPPQLKY